MKDKVMDLLFVLCLISIPLSLVYFHFYIILPYYRYWVK